MEAAALLGYKNKTHFYLFQVVFEGILERGYQGDIAIDDIRVFDGQCQESPTFDETRREDEARRREIVAAARKRTRN